ncbi:hypothetical protein ACJ72_03696 [Emergomyces africanus]|uniref:Uncharacterized protein n=1 Tax=Emergomyces africanus TaxID=1955775 RepID=A0A1B7NYU8_9EURO|nr:hypothetical protein ACJ72_03696 [Emergomyces africanus]
MQNGQIAIQNGQIPIQNGQIPIQNGQIVIQPQAQDWSGWAIPVTAPLQEQQQQQQQLLLQPQPQRQQWFAPTPQQLHAQNVAAAQVNGAEVPRQLIPYNPPAGQAFWVSNLDGTWSLRALSEIHNKLNGQWLNSTSGYPYFKVHAPKAGS